MRAAVADACGQPWVGDASAHLVVAAVPEREAAQYGPERGTRYALMEAGAAVENVLLLATACGVASAWVGAFDDGALASALSLPQGMRPLTVIPIGRGTGAEGGTAGAGMVHKRASGGAEVGAKARRIPVQG